MMAPTDRAHDDAMLEGMEGLIAAVKDGRGAPGAASPTTETTHPLDEDQLAGTPSRAGESGLLAQGSDEPRDLERGSVVGRLVVLQRLGAGGMGVVYAAYDPELDRKVALKLLLPGATGSDGRLRLLREAQALAKLAHPNVVAIHDVGTVGEQVWLAMEFVQGRTLSTWLKTPHRWQDVLAVMREAGKGLVAAHTAGLLHRDFKPDNVMVGDDGRVRVMDFGLARVHEAGMPSVPDESQMAPVLATLVAQITSVGAIMGTPSYMAPEQLGNAELTAAADQFAFCVTLWEALYGERPFGGRTLFEIVANVIAGRLRPPPRHRAVPSWLRRACERGLAIEPKRRWPSMDALLDTLATGRTRAWVRKSLTAVSVLAVLAASAEGYRRLDVARRTEACEASGNEIDSAWNEARRRALYDALIATGPSHAVATADKVMPVLDEQAAAWREARVEVCLDAEVRGQWDSQTLDRSLWCLDQGRAELESLVDVLTQADAQVLQRAILAAMTLESVAPCRDAKALERLVLPSDEHREAIRAVRDDVTRAVKLDDAGRYAEGLEQARGALARAKALAWRPLTAWAELVLGQLLEHSGAYAEAEAVLEDAYFDAAEGVAPEPLSDAASQLVFVVGVKSERFADARRWSRLADVASRGISDHGPRRARLLISLAQIEHLAGHQDEAKALAEQAVDLLEQSLGPEHIRGAMAISTLANFHIATGDYDGAKVLFERVLAIVERTLGQWHPQVAHALKNLAAAYQHTGDYARAKALLERALDIYEEALDPNHAEMASLLNNLAVVHKYLDEIDEAEALYERALVIYEAALGPDHPSVAVALMNLALLKTDTGAYDEAIVLHQRALAIFERALGSDHPHLGYPLVGLATIALLQGRSADAIAPASRALAVRDVEGVAAELVGEAAFALARALWDAPLEAGRDRVRAKTLAERARAAYREANESNAETLAEVEQWLRRVDSGEAEAEKK